MYETKRRLKIVFMGTPAFAATVLRRLYAWDGGEVVAVYCQPDRPAGRGHKCVFSPVKVLGLEKGVSVFQPLHFRDDATCTELAALAPDILAVAAYGIILPQRVLHLARLAPLNVHGSLLPLYRGAAPIQRAIMDGHQETGVSIMRMDAGLDTGPLFAKRAMPIADHTAGSLHDALAAMGAELLIEVIQGLTSNRHLPPVAQDNYHATHAPKLSKADGHIDWNAHSRTVHACIRGLTPWPGAQARILTHRKGILSVVLSPGRLDSKNFSCADQPGEIYRLDDGQVRVVTLDGFYILKNVRPANRKDMDALDFAHGYLKPGLGCIGRCLPAEVSRGA